MASYCRLLADNSSSRLSRTRSRLGTERLEASCKRTGHDLRTTANVVATHTCSSVLWLSLSFCHVRLNFHYLVPAKLCKIVFLILFPSTIKTYPRPPLPASHLWFVLRLRLILCPEAEMIINDFGPLFTQSGGNSWRKGEGAELKGSAHWTILQLFAFNFMLSCISSHVCRIKG